MLVRSTNDVASVSSGGRGGNRFDRVILGDFGCEASGEDGSLGWCGSGEHFCGADVVIGSPRRGTGSRVSVESWRDRNPAEPEAVRV